MCLSNNILSKDQRLHLLATSVRGATRNGFTNGQAKMIMHELVSLTRLYCLCTDHNLRLNVYVRVIMSIYGLAVNIRLSTPSLRCSPYNAEDRNGVDVTVEVKKLILPDSTDPWSETDDLDVPTAYTMDKLNLRVSRLLVSYVLQTTETIF